MSGGTDTLKGANVSKCIPWPLLANSCEVRLSESGPEPLDFHIYTKFYLTFNVHRVTLTT